MRKRSEDALDLGWSNGKTLREQCVKKKTDADSEGASYTSRPRESFGRHCSKGKRQYAAGMSAFVCSCTDRFTMAHIVYPYT
jgi:hypothetical protein